MRVRACVCDQQIRDGAQQQLRDGAQQRDPREQQRGQQRDPRGQQREQKGGGGWRPPAIVSHGADVGQSSSLTAVCFTVPTGA